MLDIKYVANHADEVAANCEHRHMPRDVAAIVATLAERNDAIMKMEAVRQEMNANARSMKGPMPQEQRQEKIARGRALKQEVAALDARAAELKEQVDVAVRTLPNLTHPDTPAGATDDDHRELSKWGTPRDFAAEGFEAADHVVLGDRLDLIDFESGAHVAGQKFYFLRNEAVLLDLALQRYAVDLLMKHGFTPVVTPDLARPAILEGIGFNPRGDESQVYSIDGHDLCLVGTAEITIGGMLQGELLKADRLPLKVAGISHCFRTEAGAAGRESRGLYRVHQFWKVEQVVIGPADVEWSIAEHERMLGHATDLMDLLELPYRVVNVCTGDLGQGQVQKYDIETWMPSRGHYGETHSASRFYDFQTRRLNLRYKPDSKSKPLHCHSLNNTVIASPRVLIALLENHQQADGKVRIPEALRPSFGKDFLGE